MGFDSALPDCVQYEAARLVAGAIKGTNYKKYKELAWKSLSGSRKLHILSQFYKIAKNLAPYHLSKWLPKTYIELIHYRLQEKTLHHFHVELKLLQKAPTEDWSACVACGFRAYERTLLHTWRCCDDGEAFSSWGSFHWCGLTASWYGDLANQHSTTVLKLLTLSSDWYKIEKNSPLLSSFIMLGSLFTPRHRISNHTNFSGPF